MTKVKSIKIIFLCGLLFTTACDITFKKKSNNETPSYNASTVSEPDTKSAKDTKPTKTQTDKVVTKLSFTAIDKEIIQRYYKDKTNTIIAKNMSTHSESTKKQVKKLKISSHIARSIQVVPLPLELERILTTLPRFALRVQVNNKIILMDVSSREILDIITI